MKYENTILGLLAQTSIHAGTGQNTGVIDLPIQREGHNGWPCVFGSAIKGAMRANFEQQNTLTPRIEIESSAQTPADTSSDIIFGPKENTDYASAVMISDARLVLFPVRSLSSQFKWLTCPAALERLRADQVRFGFEPIHLEKFSLTENQAIIHQQTDQTTDYSALYLEEYRFDLNKQCLDNTLNLLRSLISSAYTKIQLAEQLVIVSNNNFNYLVQHATPVNAHIAIESETKTVKTGALWYEETLPPETLLYVGISAMAARNELAAWQAEQVLNVLLAPFVERPWLQIGGNETVGMGWCSVCDIRDSDAQTEQEQ